jgi:predicted MFS family arabinose efflux permease
LNLSGALLVYVTLKRTSQSTGTMPSRHSRLGALGEHLRSAPLRAGFGIGFLILFTFIGVFTYVNFVLVREPLGLSAMQLGFVYFVFLPSIFTTPLAGKVSSRLGTRPTFWAALGVAGVGLPLLLTPSLPAVLAGLALIGIGTFFAQAVATGFVSRAATADRGAASGMYLASYFLGGLMGSAILGQLFDRFGWSACVAGLAISLSLAALLALRLKMTAPAAMLAQPA